MLKVYSSEKLSELLSDIEGQYELFRSIISKQYDSDSWENLTEAEKAMLIWLVELHTKYYLQTDYNPKQRN